MTTILVTGKTGQVGWELQKSLAFLGRVIALDRAGMDLARPDSIRDAVRAHRPDVIVNAAAYTLVDKAESEPEVANQVNAAAPGILAEEAKRTGALLIHYSTDYVFDGARSTPYREEDEPNPLNRYGKSKLAGERAVAASGADHLILRTSWVYSGRGSNFVLTILKLARDREELRVVDDQIGSPTWARALAGATAGLLGKGVGLLRERRGVYHLSAGGQVSRFGFAVAIVETMRELTGQTGGWAKLRPVSTAEYPLPARRPQCTVPSNEKIKRDFGIEMQDWKTDLRACLSGLKDEG